MAADEDLAGAPGPLRTLRAFGRDVPFYVIRFDKDGRCLSPGGAEHLVSAVAGTTYNHAIIYSHGWNNDFPTATRLYERFLEGVSAMAERHRILPADFAPVFVGIAWPSTALTFGAEDGPDIAAVGAGEAASELLAALPPERRTTAEAVLAQAAVPLDEARELALWLAEARAGDSDQEVAPGGPSGQEILQGWIDAESAARLPGQAGGFTDFGTMRPASLAAGIPRAAGWPEFLDPRWIVRLGTVLIMKDRAGVVGANGVADLIEDVLQRTGARLTLLGHSYGCKVVMTALARLSAGAQRRRVDGVLLLQPAVSRLCFAADLGDGIEGGFVRALRTVERPVLATHSDRDLPLTRIFHLVARRSLDPGELQMAGEPSRFAALGGYGADGCAPGTSAAIPLPVEGTWPPSFGGGVRVVSLDGSGRIGGHGDVNRAETHWAALNLLS